MQAQAVDYANYSPDRGEKGNENQSASEIEKAEIIANIEAFKFVLEHEIWPEMKRSFVVRKRMALFDDLTFTMITCTENLYKVFERCWT